MSNKMNKKMKRGAPCVVFVDEYDTNNLHFDVPESRSVTTGTIPINYKTVSMGTKNKDGTVSDLYFKFKKQMFSFGVSELESPETKKITGHSVTYCMYDREGPTSEQKKGVEVLEEVVKKAKMFLLDHKEDLEDPELEMANLKGLDKLVYWEMDKRATLPDGKKNPNFGKKVPDKGPTMSPKLVEFPEKKDGAKIRPAACGTIFYLGTEVDANGNMVEVDPFKYISTKISKNYFSINPLIKMDAIYVGKSVKSFQVKLAEADIFPSQMGRQRLLHNQMPCSNKVEIMIQEKPKEVVSEEESNSKTDGSSVSAVSEEKPVEKKKKIVKKKKEPVEELVEDQE